MSKSKKFDFHKGMVYFAWLLIFIGVGGLIWYTLFTRTYQTTNDAQVDQYITPVSSRVPGFVQEVRYTENQRVKKGDTLIVIDPEEYTNYLDVANADLETQKFSAVVSEMAAETQSNQIAVINEKLENAKVEVWKTEREYKRFENLLKEKSATEQQFEQVKAAYEMALTNQKAIEKQVSVTVASTKEAQSRVTPSKSIIQSQKARKNNANLFLKYTVVVAPYDGVVGARYIQPGQYIKEGQTLVNVVSEEKWITANFRETQVGLLEVGAEVYFTVDAYPNQKFNAKIISFSPASGSKFSLLPQNNATGNFIKIEQRIPTKIVLEPKQDVSKLLAGMNVLVHAKTAQ